VTNLVRKTESLPELPHNEGIYARARQVMAKRYRLPDGVRYHTAATSLAGLDAVLPEAQSVLDDLRALARPASKLEIAKHLAVLVKSFPNAGSADGEIYGRMLIEDVGAMQPAIGDVEAGCRNLRRTSKFLPAIAEVLDALGEAKGKRSDRTREISDLIKSRDACLREVEKERQAHQEYLAYRRSCVPLVNDDLTLPPL
jgi:hypothetical protein